MDLSFSGIDRSELEDLRGDTIIKVVGVGGAGGSVVRRMIESGVDTVDYAVQYRQDGILIAIV